MTKVYLGMNGYTEVTRERNPRDEWSGEDTSTNWSFGHASLTKKLGYGQETFTTDFDIVAGDRVYFVVAIWSTGDSFSHNVRGSAEIFGVFKDIDDADALRDKLNEPKSDRPVVIRHSKGKKAIQPSKPRPYYPWDGYFDSLDDVRVLAEVVGP